MLEAWIALHGLTDLQALTMGQAGRLSLCYAGAATMCAALPLTLTLRLFFVVATLHIGADGWQLMSAPLLAWTLWKRGARTMAQQLMLWFMAFVHTPLHYANTPHSVTCAAAALLCSYLLGPLISSMLRWVYNSGNAYRPYQKSVLAMITGHCIYHFVQGHP